MAVKNATVVREPTVSLGHNTLAPFQSYAAQALPELHCLKRVVFMSRLRLDLSLGACRDGVQHCMPTKIT
jgi:hypothetical protein